MTQTPHPARRRVRPGKRDQNKRKTRRAILAAALALFVSKGFHATTTRQIARKAGIAEGTLFNYFETKDDLALCFFEEQLAGLEEWFRANRRLRRAPLPEKLFAIIHRHLERIAPYEGFIGAVYLRALQPASRLGLLSGILAQAEAAGEIPPVGDFGAYAVGLFHLAMTTHWLQDASPGKENTLALLDRCLKIATRLLQQACAQ